MQVRIDLRSVLVEVQGVIGVAEVVSPATWCQQLLEFIDESLAAQIMLASRGYEWQKPGEKPKPTGSFKARLTSMGQYDEFVPEAVVGGMLRCRKVGAEMSFAAIRYDMVHPDDQERFREMLEAMKGSTDAGPDTEAE